MRKELGLQVLLAATLYCSVAAGALAQSASEIVVQVSLTAGLRHHEAKAVWDQLLVGDVLTLIREPENAYDTRAVRVEWKGHKLGYIPRLENEAVARQLDRGNPLQARITKLTYYRNHRRKLEFEVFLPL
jgi:HIRAN domain-containing protein